MTYNNSIKDQQISRLINSQIKNILPIVEKDFWNNGNENNSSNEERPLLIQFSKIWKRQKVSELTFL